MTKNYDAPDLPFTREQVQDMLTWEPFESLDRCYRSLERNGRLMGEVQRYRILLVLGVIEENIRL